LFYDKGVIIASDTLVSYGNLAMFKQMDRIEAINKSTAISSSGDFSDFQEVVRLLKEMD